jgi:hypothetical protein
LEEAEPAAVGVVVGCVPVVLALIGPLLARRAPVGRVVVAAVVVTVVAALRYRGFVPQITSAQPADGDRVGFRRPVRGPTCRPGRR